jgi:thioredoxin
MPLKVIGEEEFEAEVLRSELPVLVDFMADWCQPCKVVAPEVEALAHELEGKAKCVRVDVDRSPRIAAMLRVKSVPTFVVFSQGRPVAAEQGAVRRARLRELLDPFLPRAQGAVRPEELAQLLQQPGVVAVDTRDAASFGRAHLPRAVSMPLEQIETRLAELTMLGVAVLYCRGGAQSKELAERLGRDGMQVAFLEGGLLAWEAAGLPVERPD